MADPRVEGLFVVLERIEANQALILVAIKEFLESNQALLIESVKEMKGMMRESKAPSMASAVWAKGKQIEGLRERLTILHNQAAAAKNKPEMDRLRKKIAELEEDIREV